MVRPGTNVISRATPPARGLPADTGVWFAAGLADEGPANTPTLLRNLGDFTRIFGPRVVYSAMYDVVETFFREGGTKLYFVRAVGPAATVATKTLNDRAGAPLPTLRVDAIGPGTYGATISVQVIDGDAANQYKLVIYRNGVVVETSPNLTSPTDAVTWSTSSGYVRVTDLASATAAPNNNPAVLATTPLVGGADDRASITDAQKTTAINAFTADLGGGQISYPGATTTTVHAALRAAALATNREAILDAPDTATVGTLTAILAGVDDEYGALFAPWIKVPGIVANTTRIVPPSALVAALISRNDSLGHSPNEPAAGANGEALWAVGVTQAFPDASRQTLNDAEVNIIRTVYGAVRLYGYRTCVSPIGQKLAWQGLGNQRLRLAITLEALGVEEGFVFDQIDGRGHKLSEVQGAILGILARHFDEGSLYGATSADAYYVDTGSSVNTPVTLANNELHAVIAAKMSPFAEMVVFEIVKVGLTEVI